MNGAIAAGHELTARAGAEALARGGNAVDAVGGRRRPCRGQPSRPLTGPCGGGFVLVAPGRAARAALLDAFTAIPGRDLPPDRRLAEVEQVLVPFDERTTQVFHVGAADLRRARRGGRTCRRAPPLRPAALALAGAARGRRPPTEGVATNAGQAAVLAAIEAILTRAAGEPRAVLRRARRRCASRATRSSASPSSPAASSCWPSAAPASSTRGELARAMVAHQARHRRPPDDGRPGRLPAGVAAAAGRPASAAGGCCTNPPPSSGGVLIAYMLARAGRHRRPGGRAGIGACAAGAGRDDARRRAAAATAASRGCCTAAAWPATCCSGAEVEAGRGELRAGARAACPGRRTGDGQSDRGTTHISVVDERGNAAAFTASNGSHSGVIVPGTGLHLNNMMGEEDLVAGRHLAPGQPADQHAGADHARARRPGAAGGRVERLQPPALGDHAGDRQRRSGTACACHDAVSVPRVHVEGDRLDCEGGLDAGGCSSCSSSGASGWSASTG